MPVVSSFFPKLAERLLSFLMTKEFPEHVVVEMDKKINRFNARVVSRKNGRQTQNPFIQLLEGRSASRYGRVDSSR